MNIIEALDLSIKVWQYLAENGESKLMLPSILFSRISCLVHKCPLCELFYINGANCPNCPLKSCAESTAYSEWCLAKCTKEKRKIAAKKLLDELIICRNQYPDLKGLKID